MTVTTWTMDRTGETAVGPTLPVVADGQLVTVLAALWSDVDGVRVQMADDATLDNLSGAQARALAQALVEAASLEPPA